MNQEQLARMRSGDGFIAALDQSGGSTPKALRLYGVEENEYSGDAQMFDLIHGMRSRMVTSPSFGGNRVLGAILFEGTMDRDIEGLGSADYLWKTKGVIPFLKIDKGLADDADGVPSLFRAADRRDRDSARPQISRRHAHRLRAGPRLLRRQSRHCGSAPRERL